jgi:hypothetical protein
MKPFGRMFFRFKSDITSTCTASGIFSLLYIVGTDNKKVTNAIGSNYRVAVSTKWTRYKFHLSMSAMDSVRIATTIVSIVIKSTIIPMISRMTIVSIVGISVVLT